MKLSIDDPRLTAYALGEITDPEELADIEAAIGESEALQAAVTGIREMGDMLSAGFDSESTPELSEFEKAKLEQEPGVRKDKVFVLRDFLTSWPFVLAAASAAVVTLVLLPQAMLLYQEDPVKGDLANTSGGDVVALIEADTVDEEKREGGRQFLNQDPVASTVGTVASNEPLAEPEEVVVSLAPVPAKTLVDSGYAATQALAGARMRTQAMSKELAASMPPPAAFIAADFDRWNAPGFNTEGYDMIEETGFRSPLVAPLSTFSIDVDTASYANVRRFLNQGQLPPEDAVRIEELINYFSYADAPPTESLEEGGDPFAVHMTQTRAPWNQEHRLLRIALKGYEMPWEERPASNLVFLLDVSGSMNDPNKLPLVKKSLNMLVNRLDQRDRVAVVVYAGASGLVLPSTTANNQDTIAHALNNLSAGGSTNAGAGIELAYKLARENFIEDGNNRVILCTDGDFNVGVTNRGDLAATADAEADKGIRLTILGFGMGNYKDGMLEELSNKGKGTYAYVDSDVEARKVFLSDLTSNLFTIAKDVKVQVEFNPAKIHAYRLIGYENRRLKAEDFNDDKKKAGDIGPGHSIVALYELIPAAAAIVLPSVDDLKYQGKPEIGSRSDEIATVKLRYKQPEADVSKLISQAVRDRDLVEFTASSDDVRFSVAVAAFGMRLSGSKFAGSIGFDEIERIAAGAIGIDPGGFRSEFTDLVRRAGELQPKVEQTGPKSEIPG